MPLYIDRWTFNTQSRLNQAKTKVHWIGTLTIYIYYNCISITNSCSVPQLNSMQVLNCDAIVHSQVDIQHPVEVESGQKQRSLNYSINNISITNSCSVPQLNSMQVWNCDAIVHSQANIQHPVMAESGRSKVHWTITIQYYKYKQFL